MPRNIAATMLRSLVPKVLGIGAIVVLACFFARPSGRRVHGSRATQQSVLSAAASILFGAVYLAYERFVFAR
jgi:hypothetical protein